jgi:AcrR family transcriptional regulator
MYPPATCATSLVRPARPPGSNCCSTWPRRSSRRSATTPPPPTWSRRVGRGIAGTLYRWFPDKAALAEALTDRYLDRLVTLYTELLTDLPPEERIGDFLHRVMARLVVETRGQKALPALLVSAMVPGNRSPAGARMRAGLEGHIRALIELRVPGIPTDLRDRTAEVTVTLAHLVIAAAASGEDDERREILTNEYIDALLAYLEAKFPSANHPAWTDPDVAVKPVFAAPQRAERIAQAD